MYYLIDVGSKSIKVYKTQGGRAIQIDKVSYKLRNIFTEVSKADVSNNKYLILSNDDKSLLYEKFLVLKDKYHLNKRNTKLFATGHFRNLLDKGTFVNEFYAATGLYFNIISQELEAHYMAPILNQYSQKLNNTILINIGGGSIEILFCKNGKLEGEPQKLDFGANFISETAFPCINTQQNENMLNEVVSFVKARLEMCSDSFQTAIYTGGELSFMKLLGYPLGSNCLFEDLYHPLMINSEDYYSYNHKLFYDYTVEELYALMPDNPAWMDGARACSAIAQAICQKYEVQYIIPSDLNLIDGVCIQEARNVVVCGSFNKHLQQIRRLINYLVNKGVNVLSPQNTNVVGKHDGFVLLDGDKMINNCKWSIETHHLNAIEECDFVIICNYDNYVGYSTAVEIGYALKCGKKIVFLEDNEIAKQLDAPYEIGMLYDINNLSYM